MKPFNTLFAEAFELEDKAKKIKKLEEERDKLYDQWNDADRFSDPYNWNRKMEIQKRLAEISELLNRLTWKPPWDKLLASLEEPPK